MTGPAIAAVTASIMATMVSAAVAASDDSRRIVVDVTVDDPAASSRSVRPDADDHGEQHEHDEDAEDDHDDLLIPAIKPSRLAGMSSCIMLDR